jgi:hypothetical protein
MRNVGPRQSVRLQQKLRSGLIPDPTIFVKKKDFLSFDPGEEAVSKE